MPIWHPATCLHTVLCACANQLMCIKHGWTQFEARWLSHQEQICWLRTYSVTYQELFCEAEGSPMWAETFLVIIRSHEWLVHQGVNKLHFFRNTWPCVEEHFTLARAEKQKIVNVLLCILWPECFQMSAPKLWHLLHWLVGWCPSQCYMNWVRGMWCDSWKVFPTLHVWLSPIHVG